MIGFDSPTALMAAPSTELLARFEIGDEDVLGDGSRVGTQVAGLESELKEEKENAENLGEIANERHELLTKLQEKVEEAEERYEEAKYRLTKAAHFERLVKRRKGLVTKLLNALRQKQKANTALKAGLDGLRTYKAAAGDESAEAPPAHRRPESRDQGSRGDDLASPRHDQREGSACDVRD
jgi:chromosome segregation ATPase